MRAASSIAAAPSPVPDPVPRILHLDDALIVVEKPSGLLSVPGPHEDQMDCVATRIRALYPDALPVHRLDQGTSGLLLLARGPEMLKRMNLAFEQRIVGKRYVALVHGHIDRDSGEIDLPLATDETRKPRQIVDHVRGRRALSRFTVVERGFLDGEPFTRVDLKPLTGRTHQLRVHLQSIGHPILGDHFYAPEGSAERFGRLHLHAAGISFIHPVRRVGVGFESGVPF